jgi:hypothetical protein
MTVAGRLPLSTRTTHEDIALASSPANPVPASDSAERRLHARQRLDQIAYIGFGPDNGGVLLDIGEEGLRCQIIGSVAPGDRCHVKFSLPSQRVALEADGEVVWANSSKQGGGIRFMDVSADTRRHLREWMQREGSGVSARRSSPIPIRRTADAGAAAADVGSIESKAARNAATPKKSSSAARSGIAASINAAQKLVAREKRASKAPLTLSIMDGSAPLPVKIAILIVCLVVALVAFASSGLNASRWFSMVTKEIPAKVSSELSHFGATAEPTDSTPARAPSLSSSSSDSPK